MRFGAAAASALVALTVAIPSGAAVPFCLPEVGPWSGSNRICTYNLIPAAKLTHAQTDGMTSRADVDGCWIEISSHAAHVAAKGPGPYTWSLDIQVDSASRPGYPREQSGDTRLAISEFSDVDEVFIETGSVIRSMASIQNENLEPDRASSRHAIRCDTTNMMGIQSVGALAHLGGLRKAEVEGCVVLLEKMDVFGGGEGGFDWKFEVTHSTEGTLFSRDGSGPIVAESIRPGLDPIRFDIASGDTITATSEISSTLFPEVNALGMDTITCTVD